MLLSGDHKALSYLGATAGGEPWSPGHGAVCQARAVAETLCLLEAVSDVHTAVSRELRLAWARTSRLLFSCL